MDITDNAKRTELAKEKKKDELCEYSGSATREDYLLNGCELRDCQRTM
jgi:hypothetical protein